MQLADARNTVNKADVCSIDVDITLGTGDLRHQ